LLEGSQRAERLVADQTLRRLTTSGLGAIIRKMGSAAEATSVWTERARAPRRPTVGTVVLVFFAVLMTLAVVVYGAAIGLLAWDVRFAYLPAAESVLHGHSPYPGLHDPILEDQKGYVYPPQLVLLLLPLTALPVPAASVLVAVGLLALLWLTLKILGIRDIRCYAAAFLWVPSVSAVLLGNLSIPFAFALAVAWRYRDRVWPPAWALGLAIAGKFLLWPMLIWTLATRRVATTIGAVAIGLVATSVAWAAIGFDGLTGYPALLRRLSDIQSERSYSIVGMTATAGLGGTAGRVLTLLAGGALLAGCVVLARRRDEARSFTCAVAATLVLSPIVWLHYLVVLLVPMSILRPRFTPLWLLPVLLWISPKPGYAEGVLTFAPAIAATILLGFLLARPQSSRPLPEPTPA
jgi:alpha-1,2-mannosyltransferase